MHCSSLIPLIAAIIGISSGAATAAVTLSSYNFSPAQRPVVYAGETLPIPYKVRVKIINVPGYGDGFHAATSPNNNGYQLDAVPPCGQYPAELYWIKYAPDGITALEIGPKNQVSLTINYPPVPTISVDGYANGAVITRIMSGGYPLSYNLGVHYRATDANSNLSGIRSNVWNATTGYFDNAGGGFVSQSGASGEVYRSVFVSSDGDWYVWTDAQDSYGAYISTGAWGSGYKITVQQAPKVNWAAASPSTVIPNQNPLQSVTLSGNATDPNNNLYTLNFYVNGPGMPGWNYVGSFYNAGGTGNLTGSVLWAPPRAGQYSVLVRANDPYSQDWNGGMTANFSANTPSTCDVSASSQTIAAGSQTEITVNGYDVDGNLAYLNVDQTSPNSGWYGVGDTGTEYPPSNSYYAVANGYNANRKLTVTLNTPGTYTFRASATDGSAWYYSPSTVQVVVTAPTPPSITTQPSNQTVNQGGTATFTVAATGVGQLGYQWRKNGGNLTGETNASLVLYNVQTSASGSVYSVVVNNPYGSVTSSNATLTVNGPPIFATQPANQVVSVGLNALFTVVASGTPSPTYQWQRLAFGGSWAVLSNGGSYLGVTTASLSVTNVAIGMNGDQFRCVASNSGGSATSNAATLTAVSLDPNADADGDGVTNGVELLLGLNPFDAGDVTVQVFEYDRINQLKRGPGPQYIKDAEGNIKEIRP